MTKMLCEELLKELMFSLIILAKLTVLIQVHKVKEKQIYAFIFLTISSDCLGSPSLGDLGWSYQSCTEFVMPMCSDGVNDMFENQPWDFQTFSDACYDQWKVRPRSEWQYIEYGGENVTDLRFFSNIAFTNGNLDPWSSGGVRTTVAPSLPAISIIGGAHHLDLRSANKADPPSVIQAREQVVMLIERWIS